MPHILHITQLILGWNGRITTYHNTPRSIKMCNFVLDFAGLHECIYIYVYICIYLYIYDYMSDEIPMP